MSYIFIYYYYYYLVQLTKKKNEKNAWRSQRTNCNLENEQMNNVVFLTNSIQMYQLIVILCFLINNDHIDSLVYISMMFCMIYHCIVKEVIVI